ncbi:MAG: saccharopine dehydrogenase [Bacteroidetes bacterium GWF2_43_63]|nr:MAG: saccharopine dehydrogenase [Bacteroidetes bacterium GWE2_42_42]OFY54672.1 MAG: saccharopine dehydrogenase [Bacteroidetes bacterium GWF2_43_63]HBG71820.1 saccharopine dehydrogenase [Bacteroidales bacterium]HCB61403.1 saccharopine dehydrogenase [Bacteroidales bacterium]HCY23362.1 saccharopine dehydrogenase [Bacteroidales bacterium]
MKNILILGAGLSASTLIRYLLQKSEEHQWTVTVADRDLATAKRKTDGYKNGKAVSFDIADEAELATLIKENDLIVSMMPAFFHPVVAKQCLNFSKHLFTASYVSPEMKSFNEEATAKNLIFFNECGVDPGIDHMSAMKVIDEIRANGGKITGFESNCGGLIAPEFDTNPWNYKFTWNARNVILAGQAGARFLHNGKYKYIPYTRLYERIDKTSVLNFGEFEIYANRDSLSYKEVYGLEDVQTIVRGTMRRPGYCTAWNCFVQLGVCDDTYELENPEKLTYRSFIESFLPEKHGVSVEDNFCQYLNIDRNGDIFKKMEWLGLFTETPVGAGFKTPAQILQSIIEPKWQLEKNDLDLLVIQHTFDYELNGKKFRRMSSMGIIGTDTVHTAMSITVGTPLAIAIELFLTGKITGKGVQIPVKPEYYNPILDGLKPFGVEFFEEEQEI